MTHAHLTTGAPLEVVSPCGSIRLELLDEHAVVHLAGEIDANLSLDGVRRLAEAVRSAARPVQVDCSAATFFGAEGLSVLALLQGAAPGGHFAAMVANPGVELVLDAHPRG